MKKFLLGISFVILILSGCSLFGSNDAAVPDAEPEETQLENKVGEIKTLEEEGFLTGPSEFILVIDSGEKIFVDSVAVNLKKYIDRRVEVEGRWNDDETVFLFENVTSLTNDIQDKESYQNSEFGLKFRYPQLWVLKEEQSITGAFKVIITPYEVPEIDLPLTDHIIIDRSENNSRKSPSEWLGLGEMHGMWEPPDLTELAGYKPIKVGVALLDAVEKRIGPSGDKKIEIYVARDTYMYKFVHNTANDADKDTYRNAFFDLLASFEFIPFGPATDIGLDESVSTPLQPETSTNTSANTSTNTPAEVAPEPVANAVLASQRGAFVDYVKGHIAELAPEETSLGGTWYVTSVEFAEEEEGRAMSALSAYVIYSDGHDMRKILALVEDRNNIANTLFISAYFKPGDSTDWEIVHGIDSTKSSGRSGINLNDGSRYTVKSNMNTASARGMKASIQYPSNWYWAYTNGGINFSDKSVTAENVLVRFTKDPEALPSNMINIGEINGFLAVEGEMAEAYTICIQGVGDEEAKYCLSGDPSYKDTMRNMIETVNR